MIEFPSICKTNEDKVKFLYRALELLRFAYNEKKISWDVFEPKTQRVFSILNPIKEKLGMFQIDEIKDPDNPKLKLKEQGKKEAKWDKNIKLSEI